LEKGKFVNFTEKDGLGEGAVSVIYGGSSARWDTMPYLHLPLRGGIASGVQEYSGLMWFGTEGGLSRGPYPEGSLPDGKRFINFTTEDGLAGDRVLSIYGDSDGVLWIGTLSGGVSLYDGHGWSSLDTRDGLVNNTVNDIYEDEEGFLWFATGGGLTRYHRSRGEAKGTCFAPTPSVRIVSLQTDRTYTALTALPSITVGNRVTIEYHAIDFKTHPEKRAESRNTRSSG